MQNTAVYAPITFEEIVIVMINEDIAPRHREFNIMDTMIKMMEKYTDHLEDIVAERTSELAAEKAKTDELLYRMLPRLESIFARCIAEK